MNRRHRLRGRGRFAAIRRAGAEGRCGLIRVRALSTGDAHARAGLAVSGARSAVERNRARRLLRSALAPALVDMRGIDVVVSAPARVGTLGLDALARDVACALREAALRRASA